MAVCVNAYALPHKVLLALGEIEAQDSGQQIEGLLLLDLRASGSGSAPEGMRQCV